MLYIWHYVLLGFRGALGWHLQRADRGGSALVDVAWDDLNSPIRAPPRSGAIRSWGPEDGVAALARALAIAVDRRAPLSP